MELDLGNRLSGRFRAEAVSIYDVVTLAEFTGQFIENAVFLGSHESKSAYCVLCATGAAN